MVRPFRHPVNAADRLQGGMPVEDRITVKGARAAFRRAPVSVNRRRRTILLRCSNNTTLGELHLSVAAG
jgi:hypothetical protein